MNKVQVQTRLSRCQSLGWRDRISLKYKKKATIFVKHHEKVHNSIAINPFKQITISLEIYV